MSDNSRKSRKIVLFEMNEVPFRVIDYFVGKKPKSNLAEILSYSKQINTVCEDQVELDPWISWPTLHRGVIDQQHQIFHLGQALEEPNQNFPPIWEIIASHGHKVGVFGSLHSSAIPSDLNNFSFYLPDFFDDKIFAFPDSLKSFQTFNLTMTRESARNVNTKIPVSEAIDFLLDYLKQGISLYTIRLILSQLFNERLKPYLKLRRRAIQPAISMDIFLSLMQKFKPDFATFYTNHVAAAMHRYWTAAFPDDVPDNLMSDEWCTKYQDEIFFSMNVLDNTLDHLKKFVDRQGYLLIITSSLGQAAIKSEESSGLLTITDISKFMMSMGLEPHQWTLKHTMVPTISVNVDENIADLFETNLKNLSADSHRMVGGHKEVAPLSYDRQGGTSFHILVLFDSNYPPSLIKYGEEEIKMSDLGVGLLPHQDNVSCAGRHTPFGSLIVYDPLQKCTLTERFTISTLDLAPAILNNFGINQLSYLNSPDASLLDVNQLSTLRLDFSGGGVEIPVNRRSLTQIS
jgi:hypothetical protein